MKMNGDDIQNDRKQLQREHRLRCFTCATTARRILRQTFNFIRHEVQRFIGVFC